MASALSGWWFEHHRSHLIWAFHMPQDIVTVAVVAARQAALWSWVVGLLYSMGQSSSSKSCGWTLLEHSVHLGEEGGGQALPVREQLTLAVVFLGAWSEYQPHPVGTARGVSSHWIAQSFLGSASPHVSASHTGSRATHQSSLSLACARQSCRPGVQL